MNPLRFLLGCLTLAATLLVGERLWEVWIDRH